MKWFIASFSISFRTDDDYNTVNWYAILVKEDGKWRIREFNPGIEKTKSVALWQK